MSVRAHLLQSYLRVRHATEALAAPLSPEDQQLQSMPDCSPTKWHRAHTTWFFEAFILQPRGVPPFDERFGFLFNSYYEALGPRHARPRRGLLSRPTANEVTTWRRVVDERMVDLLQSIDDDAIEALRPLVTLGLAHEEQHQELLLTDILHAFSGNPLQPAYAEPAGPDLAPAGTGAETAWFEHDGGLCTLGTDGDGFCFDNETPRHRVWLEPFSLASRLVTVGEMKAFIEAGGYDTPSLWLSEGLDFVRRHALRAPQYARFEDGTYEVFGLRGPREARDEEPVSHLSYYEADALARFLGGRLPSEAELEVVMAEAPVEGNFVDSGALRPLGGRAWFGDAWQWTRSAYAPYPGFEPPPGAVGEYNGKFMVSQLVLKGGSCFAPPGHIRASYRNFWPPGTRFQVTGLRLARDRGRR